jgi:hypothetical protein
VVQSLRALAGGFGFSGDEIDKRCRVLSGGEKGRMMYGKLMLTRPNVLLLDEPTNHMDMETIESLQIGLEKYPGTLLFVSHDREFVSGLAEVVKYGVILDAEFFAWLEDHAAAILAREPAAVGHAVERSAALKARVVEQDERETAGLRAALNYGHTFAHAYETAAGYGVLLHGEAVAIGMARAARLAERCGRISCDLVARQDRLLERFRLPVAAPESLRDAERLIEIMGRDKKTLDGQLRFVLPSKLGHVDLVDERRASPRALRPGKRPLELVPVEGRRRVARDRDAPHGANGAALLIGACLIRRDGRADREENHRYALERGVLIEERKHAV